MKRWLLVLAIVSVAPAQGFAQGRCDGAPYRRLDFWVGDWVVRVGDQVVGTNRIAKTLGGCAIVEEWTASDGGLGRSLFYYVPAADEWRQVWVTQNPAAPGGVKEKREIARLDGGALRFQGTIAVDSTRSYLDRTTLTPLDGGRVRQLIEISTDGGTTWRGIFDAVYERAPLPATTADGTAWRPGPWPGTRIASLESGAESRTFLLELPDGFWIMPHTHPSVKRVTVISGTLLMGHGATFDSTRVTPLQAGAFQAMPAGQPHFEGARGVTVVQFSAVGPWGTTFVGTGPQFVSPGR